MAVAAHYNSRKASLTIGGKDVTCFLKKVHLWGDDTEEDASTYCAPGARDYGETTWTLEIDVVQSFGDAAAPGLHDTLQPFEKTVQTFELNMDKTAASPSETAPKFTGTAAVPTIPILDAEIAAKSIFTLTFLVQAAPVKVIA